MMRSVIARWLLLVMMVGVLAACQPQPTQDLPTLVVLDAATPTAEATPTLPATDIPQASPTPRATPVPVGRFAEALPNTARIRVVHTAAETGAVDLYVNGQNINSNLAYPNSTGITPIAAGSYTLTAALNGANPQSDALISREFTIGAGESKLILLVGTPDAPNLTVYDESLAPLAADQSRVNFINAVPRLPDTTVQIDGIPVTVPLAFDRDSGAFEARVGLSTIVFENGGQLYATINQDLRPRTVTTFILVGSANATDALRILAFETDAPGQTLIRVANLSESVRNIRLTVNDAPFTDALESSRFSEQISRASGVVYVSVFDAASAETPLIREQAVTLDADAAVTLAFMGTADAPLLVPIVEDISPVRPDFSRITFVNALPGAPVVEIGFGMDVYRELAPIQYGTASVPLEIMREPYAFFAQVVGTEERVEVTENFIVEASRSYLFFITGRTDSQPVVVSMPIPTDESLIGVAVDATPQPFSDSPLQIRFVNFYAAQQPIRISVLNEVVAQEVPFANQTAFIPFSGLELVVTAIDLSGNLVTTATHVFDADARGRYSVYIGGRIPALLVVESDNQLIVDPNFPTLRLVNLTNDPNHVFKLMLSTASPQPLPPLVGEAPPPRPSAPLGAPTVVSNTRGRSVSAQGLAPSSGAYNLLLIDGQGLVATTLYNVTLESGKAYELVTNELFDTGEIQAYLVAYPQP